MYILLTYIIYFFALYGALQIFTRLAVSGFRARKFDNVFTVIMLTNDMDAIENTVRLVMWRTLVGSLCCNAPDILLVSSALDEESEKIINKLTAEYEFVHFFTKDEYLKLFTTE